MQSDPASAHDELVERVADVISMVFEGAGVTETAKGVIALALEEAAKMCEECPLYDEDGVDWNTDPRVTLAAAIRAME
jgi:hypothetical protein